MDDFFVPSELKSKARLEEPGGNVHYERFAEEVLQGLKAQRSFTYGVFDCGTQRIARQAEVLPKRLNIIEGSYSMHPAFGDPYHLKVFLKVSPERQRERIIRRRRLAPPVCGGVIPLETATDACIYKAD